MPYSPAIIGTNDVVRVTYNMVQDEQQLKMVLHCEPFTIVESDYFLAMEDLVGELVATLAGGGFWNPIKALQSDQLTYESIQVQRISPTRDVLTIRNSGVTGDSVDAAVPPNVALSVTKHTLLASRRGVGRIQIPGFPKVKLVNGRWDQTMCDTIQTDLEVKLTTVLTTDAGNEWRWVLPQIGQPFGPYQPITGVTTHNTVRTMHRRTVGLGI